MEKREKSRRSREKPPRGERRGRFAYPLRYALIALIIAASVMLNMAVIFAFSAESREESGDRSGNVTEMIVRLLYPGYDDLSFSEQVDAVESVHRIVRKAAHFLEYALLGFLTAALMLFLRRYLSKRRIERWKTWFYPTEFCFLYAVSDEVHQIFSDRGSSAKDVIIDTAGAVFGIILIQLIVGVFGRLLSRKKKKKAAAEDDEATPSSLPETEDDGAHDPACGVEEAAPCELPPTE